MNPNGGQLIASMQQFIRMYNPHEAREDTVLFPAFRKIVSPHEFDALGEDFEKKEDEFVGGCEVVFGALLIVGLLTRLAAIVLLIDISVAIVSTKIPVLLGHGFWGFSLVKLPRYGFWSMMHEARTDFSMWLGLLFLLIVGAVRWSFDAALMRGRARSP